MSTLYELTADLQELQQMLLDGEVDEEVLNDTIEAVNGAIEVKAEGYGCIIRNMEADMAALKLEEERLAKRRAALTKNRDWLTEHMHKAMLAMEKKSIKTQLFTWGVRANPAKVVITDEASIPFEFMNSKTVTTTTPDKVRIKEYLQSDAGAECEWAKLESDTRITLS